MSATSERRIDAVLVLAMLFGPILLIASVAFLRTDEYVTTPTTNPGGNFCGSAYDVLLLKKNGYMGGEVPNNDEIDHACMVKARRDVITGGALGVIGLAAFPIAAVRIRAGHRRARARNEARRDAALAPPSVS